MRFDGSAALKLDFGSMTTTSPIVRGGRTSMRLAPSNGLDGRDKYQILDHRRRQAQIRARRLLDLMEEAR
jgi:hypothetical protein